MMQFHGLSRGVLPLLCAVHSLAETTSIYKVDYPEKGLCGQEENVTRSNTNPHWFFPVKFGGFSEGNCSDVGYTEYNRTEAVEMHPLPGVHHTLSFDLYAPSQSRTVDVEFKDEKQGRTVKIKLCMPLKAGRWPLYIFGHGAGCAPEDYQYFCQVAATAMVYRDSRAGPVFPADFDTEGSALDAAFLAKHLPEVASSDEGSPLFGKLDGTVIMGGHSMGGGMTVLSVGMDRAEVDGIVLFAPGLYTKPDAAPFLPNITAPALIVSGSMDCGQNALDKQAKPAFDGLASASKFLVVLKGANHCQWIQPFEQFLGVCSTFEKNECHGISRALQHRLGARLVAAFHRGIRAKDGWAGFERALAAGASRGAWSYTSSTGSGPNATLHNDCPCQGAGGALAVV